MARRRVRGSITGANAGPNGTLAQTSATLGGVPNVQYVRPELRRMFSIYGKIRDCISGSEAVKAAGDKYLPRPNAVDTSDENRERYNSYLTRAVFYNVLRRTVYALVGQIFLRAPQVDIPANLDVLKLDATGENVSLEQVAKQISLFTLSYGRAGLHVDYPTALKGLSAQQLASGYIRPTINPYSSPNIVNWRKALRGAKQVYTLVVIAEPYILHDDGFEAKSTTQYKVLRLIPANGINSRLTSTYNNDTWYDDFGFAYETAISEQTDVYMIEVWRSSDGQEVPEMARTYQLAEEYYPRDSKGKFLNEIPFLFVGAEANDDSIDHPPSADLAELNLAHYRNSADYEETSFLTGQPTPFVSGVTEEWNNNVLKGNIQLGSRGVIALPNGGTAGLLQAEANGVPFEAMQAKERQMVALGAKLVEQRAVQRTATEAQMEGTADTSILAQIAKNVSIAVEWSVKQCCLFTGDDPTTVSFVLNTEFDLTRMDPAERQQLLNEWLAGMITSTEMRANLRRGGVATLDDDEYKAEAKQDAALRLEELVAKTKAIANAQPQPTGTGGGGSGGNNNPQGNNSPKKD